MPWLNRLFAKKITKNLNEKKYCKDCKFFRRTSSKLFCQKEIVFHDEILGQRKNIERIELTAANNPNKSFQCQRFQHANFLRRFSNKMGWG